MSNAAHRFYILGRRAADDEFDTGEYDLGALARKILDGADLRKTLSEAVTAEIAFDDFDGSRKDWEEEYEEELEKAPCDAAMARREWQRGYIDEATLQLEDEVVEQMDEMLEDDESDGDEYDYSQHTADGNAEAADWWDDDQMESYVKAAQAKVDASGWTKKVDRNAMIQKASGEEAERAVADEERQNEARTDWVSENAEDIRSDGGNPELAYTKYWRPAFVAALKAMIAERVAELY